MNATDCRRLEQWFAAQFKAMAGGYTRACALPGSPIGLEKLSQAGQGRARLWLGDAIYLAEANGRADLLRTLADQIDGGESEAQRITRLARQHCYHGADLARKIDEMDADGVRSAGEVHEVRTQASEHLRQAQDLMKAAEALVTGPVRE